MIRPAYGDGTPIAAIATALAESALSVVRASGPGAVELASRAFSRPRALAEAPGNTLVHGWILDAAGGRVDEVVAAVFRAPRSYTGEDAVEFTCHGGIAVTRAVLGALAAAGFREALPGEFTFRAFMNGKLDLTRAESVMELVGAKTDEARGRAAARLSGALEREITAVKDLLVRALAAAELLLDYSEDDGAGEEEAGMLPDREAVEEARDALEALAASYRTERLYRDGATVAVAGRPNAGKSSLFNRLVKEERSIVSDVPGTTRDWIEAWMSIEGIPVRLVDTAGLRETEDPVERTGVARSRSMLDEADLIVYAVDGTAGLDGEDRRFLADERRPPIVVAWNKADLLSDDLLVDDLLPRGVPESDDPAAAPAGAIAVSAETGIGIPALAARIAAELSARPAGGEARGSGAAALVGIATARQKELIDRAADAVSEALRRADAGLPLDLVAPELREAVDALGEITGEVTTSDLLETMFGRFCVGK